MKKMLSLTAAVATLISCPDAHAQSSSFDILFEANGTTYTLYSQSFPLELSVDEFSWGSFRDIFDKFCGILTDSSHSLLRFLISA